jgi:predicted O-methyltransferase YrrM
MLDREWRDGCENNDLFQALDRILRERVIREVDGGVIDIDIVATRLQVYQTMAFWLSRMAPSSTVETGFGLGVTALMFAAYHAGRGGRHIAIDPYFLDGDLTQRARRAIAALQPGPIRIVREASEFALPRLILTKKIADLSFSFIDGSHLFDHVLIDFFYLDRATRVGGIIAIDDIRSPAVEAAVSFIAANRSYYIDASLGDVALCQKMHSDDRPWHHFRPFTVPDRMDWTLRPC